MRSLELFYRLFLIDPIERKAVQLCPFVKSGIMHKDFQKFLRPDGLGIDYTHLDHYDTLGALNADAKSRVPGVERALKNALETNDKGSLDYALFLAREIHLEKFNAPLFEEAQQRFSAMP